MPDKDYTIQNSQHTDISNQLIQDYLPESLLKIYPYRAIYGSREDSFIGTNTTTIARIAQYGVNDFVNLKEDDNGKKYFEIFSVVDNETKLAISSGTSTIHQEIRKLKTFTAITNDYFDTEDDKPDFFTIGEPFDEIKYNNGEQFIYYGTSFSPTLPEVEVELIDQGFDIDDNDRISQLILQDVSALEEQFTKSRLLFTENSLPLDNITNIKLRVLPNMMLDTVKVKGISTDPNSAKELIDIDFKSTSKNLSWFNIVPIGTKDKLTISPTWFDENITLDKPVIETILTYDSMKWIDFVAQYSIPDSLKELVLDMMLYNYEFQNSFAQVPRTDAGALAVDYLIGTKKAYVSAIANGNPVQAIDGLYRKWRKLNPTLVGGEKEQLVKAFINAISSEMTTSLATANGENDFNQNTLPWTLKLSKALDIDKTSVDKWIQLQDFEFKVSESAYFKKDNNTFKPLDEIDLSEVKFIESERKITLPELPYTIDEIDKMSLPGEISTSSAKDLKYMLKLPLESDEIDLLYSGTTGQPGLKTLTLSGTSLSEKINAYTTTDAKTLIEKQILKVYPDATSITKAKEGTDQIIADVGKYTVGNVLSPGHKGWWIFSKDSGTELAGKKAQRENVLLDYIINRYNTKHIGETALREERETWEWANKNRASMERDGWTISQPGVTPLVVKHPADGSELSYFKGENYFFSYTRQLSKTLLKLEISKAYKIDNYDDIVVLDSKASNREQIPLYGMGSSAVFGYTHISYSFYIKRHAWQGYEYTFQTNLPSKELVHRKVIYDRPKWKQLIKSILNPSNGLERTIDLEEKWDTGTYQVKDIIISSLFGDTIKIDFLNGHTIDVDLFQRDDETSTTQTIKFF